MLDKLRRPALHEPPKPFVQNLQPGIATQTQAQNVRLHMQKRTRILLESTLRTQHPKLCKTQDYFLSYKDKHPLRFRQKLCLTSLEANLAVELIGLHISIRTL